MYIRGNTCGSYWLAFIIVVNVYALRMHKGIAHLMERGSWFCIRTQTSVLQCTLRVCIIDRFGDMMQLIFLMLSVSYSLCIFRLICPCFFQMSYIDMSDQRGFHVCVYAQVLERGACATFPSSTIHLHLNRLVRFHGDITFHANMHPCLACESTGVPATTARERITPCVGDTGPALRACSASATCIADYFIFPGRSANDELGL